MQTGKIGTNDWGDMDQKYHVAMHERHDQKLDAILEYVRDIPDIKHEIAELKVRVDGVELKLDVVSRIVKEHGRDIRAIKSDIAALKPA